MAIPAYSTYVARLGAPFQSCDARNGIAGTYYVPSSQWRTTGGVPSTALAPTSATTGALGQSDSSGVQRVLRWSSGFAPAGNTGSPATVILYDRLSHQGGLSGTVISSQTTNLPTAALTRYTSGVGVQAWIEIYTAIGSTAVTASVGYDSDSGTGHTAPAFAIADTSGNLGHAFQISMIPLASGDKGFKAVNSVLLSASTGTAGNFGVTLGYPLCVLSLPVVGSVVATALIELGAWFPAVPNGACLALLSLGFSGTTPGRIDLAED